jgi:hypothetical protein
LILGHAILSLSQRCERELSMDDFPVPVGHEAAVSVFIDEEVTLGVVFHRTGSHTVESHIYSEDAETLDRGARLLTAALEAVKFAIEKPAVRKEIDRVIKMLREEIAREEGEPPSPADDVLDIPF